MVTKPRPSKRERRFSLDDVAQLSRLRRSGATDIRCPECHGRCDAVDDRAHGSWTIVIVSCTECGRGVVIEDHLSVTEDER